MGGWLWPPDHTYVPVPHRFKAAAPRQPTGGCSSVFHDQSQTDQSSASPSYHPAAPLTASPASRTRPWVPKQVLVTPSARAWSAGAAMAQRAAALGAEIIELRSDRLAGLPDSYRDAKTTMAIMTASPSRRRLQPIPPSADWRFDVAEGCPAHCSYCYLAGSLAGPPIIRAYANLPEILAELLPAGGQGTVTSRSEKRVAEGTTFECSCYTDPLALEHLTGHLAACISHFGAWDEAVQLRFTTKFDAVGPLLGLVHNRRTRIRFSVNAKAAGRHEGGAPRMAARLAALRAVALAGYPVGLTVAPILRVPEWARAYDALFADVRTALAGLPAPDLTVELITHRFTPKSKTVLTGWYPGSPLEMDEATRTRKTTKFGSLKWVFPKEQMVEMRTSIEASIAAHLPFARLLYWT